MEHPIPLPTREQSSGSLSRRESQEARLRASLLDRNYALLKNTSLGMVVSCSIAALILALRYDVSHRWVWATWTALCCVYSVAVYVAWTRRTRTVPDRATTLRRIAAFLNGTTWGLAGMLWPLGSSADMTIALVLCLAGLTGAAIDSLAADPTSFLAMAVGLAPGLFASEAEAWITACAWAFVGTCYFLTRQNHRRLRHALRLTIENADLLAHSRDEADAAALARDQAEAAVASKTRFLAAASHDLRQPVQALLLFSEVLTRDLHTEGRTKEAALAVQRSSEALSSLLERLLDLSRHDAGIVVDEPTVLDVGQLLSDIAAGLADQAEAVDSVISTAGPSLDGFADRVLLSRVVMNLATNAIRHSGSDRILLTLRSRGAHLLIQVWDQGSGIPEQALPHIFEEFVRAKRGEGLAADGGGIGLGLGLAMVKRICDLTGWELTVRTREGRGTVFAIEIPAHSGAPEDRADGTTQAAAFADIGQLSVLVVEDDPWVASGVQAFLESRQITVKVAQRVEDAKALLAAECSMHPGDAVDVVLTDHDLPGSNSGVDLLAWVHESRPHTGRILMTGNSLAVERAESLPFISKVLEKPIDAAVLWEALAACSADVRAAAQSPSERAVTIEEPPRDDAVGLE